MPSDGNSPILARKDHDHGPMPNPEKIVSRRLLNNSGLNIDWGDVVIQDTSANDAFTVNTTVNYSAGWIGVAQQPIGSNTVGSVLLSGYTPVINLGSNSTTRGFRLYGSNTARTAYGSNARTTGAFGQVLTTSVAPDAIIWSTSDGAGGGGAGGGALVGQVPLASHPSLSNATAFGSSGLDTVSGGNGGARGMPIWVPAPMRLRRYRIWSTDTASQRDAEVRLYKDTGSASMTFITGSDATYSFIPSAASARASSDVSGAPVTLDPGLYWAVIRNTNTSRTFGFGVVTSGATVGVNGYLANAAVAALGATIDVTGWTAVATVGGLWLQGDVMGLTSQLL